MARDILLNELIDIMEEMAKQGGETNISLRDILVKAIDNRVTKFKSNGGKIDYNSLEDMAYQ